MPNTILLIGELNEGYDEGRVKTGETLYPGYVIEKHSDGTYKAHATAGGRTTLTMVLEDGFGGNPANGVGNTLTTAKTDGQLLRFKHMQKGEKALAVLKDGQTAADGALLTSNGDGTLKVAGGTDYVLCRADEPLDLAAAGANGFIRVRAL
jgi:hypothetical protein